MGEGEGAAAEKVGQEKVGALPLQKTEDLQVCRKAGYLYVEKILFNYSTVVSNPQYNLARRSSFIIICNEQIQLYVEFYIPTYMYSGIVMHCKAYQFLINGIIT